jgi:hypothetical protein
LLSRCGVVVTAVLCANVLAAAPAGARAEYVGGTLGELESGASGTAEAIDEHYFVFYSKKSNIRVAYDKINMLEYGQKVDRRYIVAALISPMFVLSKSRKHFLTIGYTDENGREQAMIFRVDKDHIRAMLVSLEARTGRKVQYQDEEARKAGKG